MRKWQTTWRGIALIESIWLVATIVFLIAHVSAPSAPASTHAAAYVTATASPPPTATPIVNTPTAILGSSLVSGPQLGGTERDFIAKYGPEDSQGSWNAVTIAGQTVQLTVSITHAGDSQDAQNRIVIIDIAQAQGAAWSASDDASLVAAFLPDDATSTQNVVGSGGLGPDHIFMSQRLAHSLAAGVFQNAANQQLAPGTFDWLCSTDHPLCEIAVGTNS